MNIIWTILNQDWAPWAFFLCLLFGWFSLLYTMMRCVAGPTESDWLDVATGAGKWLFPLTWGFEAVALIARLVDYMNERRT
jgi:hypothetical protein